MPVEAHLDAAVAGAAQRGHRPSTVEGRVFAVQVPQSGGDRDAERRHQWKVRSRDQVHLRSRGDEEARRFRADQTRAEHRHGSTSEVAGDMIADAQCVGSTMQREDAIQWRIRGGSRCTPHSE